VHSAVCNRHINHKSSSCFVGTREQAYTENGLMGLLRPPHLHVAPPLVITEEELLDGFDRQDKALYTLDDALGF